MSKDKSRGGFDTRAIHGPRHERPYPYRAVTPPIVSSSTYAFDTIAEWQEATAEPRDGIYYSRRNHPTGRDAEYRLADLEGSDNAALLGSGIAAITTTVLSQLQAGDHVVVFRDIYGGAVHFFTNIAPRWGIEVTWVERVDYDLLQQALRPETRLVYCESPTNPLLRIVDMERVAEIAHAAGAKVVFDNTLATPYLQRPLEFGIDGVVYSATKYLCGHSDMVLGAATGGEAWMRDVHNMRFALGPVVDPRSAYLFSRSLMTLGVRMERHCDNAERVAEFLRGHPKVGTVHYPGLVEPEQRRLAERQMRRYGALVSFEVAAGGEAAERVVDRLEMIPMAASLGGVESLIQPSRQGTHRRMTPEQRAAMGMGEGLLRLSVGMENAEDIIADLRQALEAV